MYEGQESIRYPHSNSSTVPCQTCPPVVGEVEGKYPSEIAVATVFWCAKLMEGSVSSVVGEAETRGYGRCEGLINAEHDGDLASAVGPL
jgi:hypothetical protein